jgi:hypothetical protein
MGSRLQTNVDRVRKGEEGFEDDDNASALPHHGAIPRKENKANLGNNTNTTNTTNAVHGHFHSQVSQDSHVTHTTKSVAMLAQAAQAGGPRGVHFANATGPPLAAQAQAQAHAPAQTQAQAQAQGATLANKTVRTTIGEALSAFRFQEVAQELMDGALEFCYVEPDANDPYMLHIIDKPAAVVRGERKKDYMTLSKHGLVRSSDGDAVCQSFTDFAQEHAAYHRTIKIPFFKDYRKVCRRYWQPPRMCLVRRVLTQIPLSPAPLRNSSGQDVPDLEDDGSSR